MYIWEVLGIEPTTDIVAIKRAFAQKAKNYHPEEYPEEYKNLRSAYKRAVESARQQSASDSQGSLSGTEGNCANLAGASGESHREASKLKAARIEDFFKEELTLERPPLERPHRESPYVEAPRLEKIRQEAPRIQEPILQRPRIKAEEEEDSLEAPRLELPHFKEPIMIKPPVRRPRIENVNLEIPRLKDLMLEPSDICPPFIEDPSLLEPREKKRRRNGLQAIPRELDFSFEEVERAFSPEEVEDFFYLFRALACHPILRDNIECWTLFLERDEIQNLFRKDDICRRMIGVIDKYFWGSKDTLLYFEFLLKIKTGKKMKETQTLHWKFKKLLGMLPKCPAEKLLSEEEFSLHNAILADMRKRNIAYDLIHFEAARIAYMEFFLSFMKEEREGQELRWQKARKRRIIKGILHILRSLVGPVLIVIFFILMVMAIFNLGKGTSV
ncbi:MAG: J domain-containing protein [Roseburia sp.]|nr:J domain-containing protein [Roseburia sp.]